MSEQEEVKVVVVEEEVKVVVVEEEVKVVVEEVKEEEQLCEATSRERGRSRSGSRRVSRERVQSEEKTGAKPKIRELRSRSIEACSLFAISPQRRHVSRTQFLYNPELERRMLARMFPREEEPEPEPILPSPGQLRIPPSSPVVPSRPDPLVSYFPNLMNTVGQCCGCTSEEGMYIFSTFLCTGCLEQVQEIIRNGEAIACNDDHNGPRLCPFCLTEEVYRYTSAALILPGFTRMTLDPNYLPVIDPPGHFTVVEKVGEGDEWFMEFYKVCMKDMLGWIVRQQQIYLFNADERIKLLSANGLAATLMWMAIRNVTIHNVIRGYRRYIDHRSCTSEPLRVILANIFYVGKAYEELQLDPEHLYFIKLLVLFQPEFVRIENADDYIDLMSIFYDKKKGLSTKFEVLEYLTNSYWICLNQMELTVPDLKIINKSIYWMRTVAKWMVKAWEDGALAYLEKFQSSLEKWLGNHKSFTNDNVVVGYGFSDIPEAVSEICDKTNRLTLKNFRLAQDILRNHFTRFDQSILMENNFLKFNVIHLAFSGYWEELVVFYQPFFRLRDMLVKIRKNFRQLKFGVKTPDPFLDHFLLFDPCQIFNNNIRHCPFEKFQDLFVWNMAVFLKMDLNETRRYFSPGYDYSLEDLIEKISTRRNPEEKEALGGLFKLVNFFIRDGFTQFPFLINLSVWLGDQ